MSENKDKDIPDYKIKCYDTQEDMLDKIFKMEKKGYEPVGFGNGIGYHPKNYWEEGREWLFCTLFKEKK